MKIVDGWFFGDRTFTTKDIKVTSPDDLAGKPIRFPNSPQFLANAKALGVTNPVSVAVEELYTALQQGIAVGQENPIVATKSSSYFEVLNTASLNNHQVGIHWILVSDATYKKMSQDQAALLEKTIHAIRPENRTCVEEATEEILDELTGERRRSPSSRRRTSTWLRSSASPKSSSRATSPGRAWRRTRRSARPRAE